MLIGELAAASGLSRSNAGRVRLDVSEHRFDDHLSLTSDVVLFP